MKKRKHPLEGSVVETPYPDFTKVVCLYSPPGEWTQRGDVLLVTGAPRRWTTVPGRNFHPDLPVTSHYAMPVSNITRGDEPGADPRLIQVHPLAWVGPIKLLDKVLEGLQ